LTHSASATRTLVLHFAAISISLGTAVSALGRAALYLLALWVVFQTFRSRLPPMQWSDGRWYRRWDLAVILTVAYMALTVCWTTEDTPKALWSWSDHARLITIPVLWLLIGDVAQARALIRTVVFVQLFVVLSSWLLIFDVPVPWAREEFAKRDFEVFVSYLEQSIAEAITAFIIWHHRRWIFGSQGLVIATLVAAAIIFHVLGFLPSRTGYLVAGALLLIAIAQHVPRRMLWPALLLPLGLAAAVIMSSDVPRNRIVKLGQEVASYAEQKEAVSSTGVRLTFWQTSLSAIAEKPLLGFGSGSWNREYLRLVPVDIPNFRTGRDPHQMFLLWTVEGGLVGLALLSYTLLALFAHSRSLPQADARSLQAVLAGLVVAGMTTSTIYGIGMGDFFCVTIGILLCTGKAKECDATGERGVSI